MKQSNFEAFEREAHYLQDAVKKTIKEHLKKRDLGESLIFPALENVFTDLMIDFIKSVSHEQPADKAALIITKLISGERNGMARREEILKEYEEAIAEFKKP